MKNHEGAAAAGTHNPRLPVDCWFQRPPEGLTLFAVLYTKSCRWAQCLGCSLFLLESEADVHFADIMAQTDYIFDYYLPAPVRRRLKKIILSNNGSVLDEVTFSTTALLYFVAKMNMACPSLKVFTLETRPEYVDMEELEVLSRALKEGRTPTRLEVAVGFEAYDERVRNQYFNKGLSLSEFENMVEKLSRYGFGLKVYFMQKPVPEIGEEEAVQDVCRGIDYLDRLAGEFAIPINMHLNPTFVARGSRLEIDFDAGKFSPPRLEDVRRAVLHAEGKKVSVFVGLSDEGLSVPGGSFIRRGDGRLVKRLAAFNRSGDFSLLRREH